MSVSAAPNAARAARLAAILLAGAACGGAPRVGSEAEAAGADAEGLPVRRIEIVPRNIYDPLPPGRLRHLYQLANALHVRTRSGTIRDQLLFRPGDRWSDARGRETARALRALGILEPSRLEAGRVGDSADVLVETRDDWTTQPEFAIESADGESFTSVALVERNLLGFGKAVSLAYRETPEGITRTAAYQDPNLFGSRMRLQVHGGTGTEGASQGFEGVVPFYAEDTPYAYGVRWSLVTSVAHLFFLEGEEGAAFDRRIEQTEIHWGRGVRHAEHIYRLTGSFVLRDRRLGPSRRDPSAPVEFGGDEENLHVRQLALEARWWRPGFTQWEGLDRLGGIEDVDLGPSLQVTGGLSPQWLGSTADEGYAAVRFEGGVRPWPRTFGALSLDAATRLRREPRELIARARGRWVGQVHRRHAVVLGAYAAAAHRPARDFQEILGGLSGLRASSVRALAGQQAWRLNAEHRWWIGHDLLELVSLGAVAFLDVGRTWGPGSSGAGWRQDVGTGLRIALPRSGQDRVARLDVAWPMGEGGGRGGPVFSFGSGQAF